MNHRRASRVLVVLGVVVAAGVAACSQREQSVAAPQPQVEEKMFSLTPASASVTASFLTGVLQDMRVSERVELGTGKVVEPPKFRATLKLKNTSKNQAARPIAGKIQYVGAEGGLIPLAEGRGETSFQFPYYQDRLDPGKEASLNIEVPFPAAALKEKKLLDIRLELAYIPTPYKEESVSIQVSVGK